MSPLATYSQNGKHHLCHIEGMSPIVIGHIAIILLDTEQPTAKHFVINMETFHKVEIQKHAQTGLQSIDMLILHID